MAIWILSANGQMVHKDTLESARTSADAAGKTVLVTSALTQAQSNIEDAWPSDRALRVENGGSINNSTAFIFTDSTTVVYPEWFGAKGNGVTDDTTAVQKAITSARNVVLTKMYLVSTLTASNELHLSGGILSQVKANQNNHILTLSAANSTVKGVSLTGPVTTGNVIYDGYAAIYLDKTTYPSGITIEGCTISGKMYGITSVDPITSEHRLGENLLIKDCKITHAEQGALIYAHPRHHASNVVLDGNTFTLQAGYNPASSQVRGSQVLWCNNSKIINNRSFGSQLSLEFYSNNVAQVTVNASGKTFTRIDGSWITDNKFVNGDTITFLGFKNASNNGPFIIITINDKIIKCSGAGRLVNESAPVGFPYMVGNSMSRNVADVWLSFTCIDDGVVENNVVDGSLRPAMHLDHPSGTTCGLEVVSCSNTVVTGNTVRNTPTHGIFTGQGVGPSNAAVSKNLTISNNTIQNCATGGTASNGFSGLQLGSIHSSTVSGNTIDACAKSDSGYSLFIGGSYSVGVSSDPVYDLVVANNVFRNNKASGTSGTNCAVIFGPLRNVRFIGNFVTGSKSHALNVGDGFCYRLFINNCIIANNDGAAIYVNGNGAEITMTGCLLTGNNLGPLTADGKKGMRASLFIKAINNIGFVSDGTALIYCPTTGEVGEVIKTTHATNKWQLYAVAGTAGTIARSSTANTTSWSRNITLNAIAAGNLCEGQYVTIAGVTGVKKILSIDREVNFNSGIGVSAATVDTKCSATVTNAALAYSPPTIVNVAYVEGAHE